MSDRERVIAAYLEHGEAYVLADPELRALLEADPDLSQTFSELATVDRALADLPPIAMPRALETAIRERAEAPSFWSWLGALIPTPEASLSMAALLLLLMPPLMLWMLVERQGGEAQVLELVPSTISFDMARAQDLQAREGEPDAGELRTTAEAPTTHVVPRARNAGAVAAARSALSDRRADPRSTLRVQSLVNAFAYAPARAPARLELEVAEAPWRRETLLVRVYVAAGAPLHDVQVTVAWNSERVRSYRRLAESGGHAGATSGAMSPGDAFTALYEVIPHPRIGDGAREPLAVATLRYGDAVPADDTARPETSTSLRASAVETERPSQDFRFASTVAYFALEARGELGAAPSRRVFDRIAVLAGRAIDKRRQPDRAELLALIHLATGR